MMKLYFKVSQGANADVSETIRTIQSRLNNQKYEILETTDNTVAFYDDPWVLRWNFKAVQRLDGGTFIIDNTSITLKYYLGLIQPIIGISIPVIGTITAGFYEGTIFFVAFVIIALSVQYVISRNLAKDLLTSIISELPVV